MGTASRRAPSARSRTASRGRHDDALATYRKKRDFTATPEPSGSGGGATGPASGLVFVVQKHWASRLHYDFRLEIDGTMKSWAVPKGPSLDPQDKRMAVQVEDHPMDYNRFEGRIPEGHYGAGEVIVWDKGIWEPEGDAARGWREGKLKFHLRGHKLQGGFTLVRMHGRGNEKQPPWLLIKERDDHARPSSEFSVVDEQPASVAKLPAPKARAAAANEPDAEEEASEEPTALVRAPRAKLPEALSPQLATLADAPPPDLQNWLFELKFDGYRLLARIERGRVKLFTRNGHDWTHKLASVAEALVEVPLASGWIDGEVVALGENGAPDFQALQNAFDRERTNDLVFYAFDMPFADGHDLRGLPLEQRRDLLQVLVAGVESDRVRFSDAFAADPESLVTSACSIGFEGVIGKRRDAHYASRRNADWIKLKCSHRQEFVIGGYTDPQGSRSGLGSLLLGVHDEAGKLRYAGNVGTGFSSETLLQLHRQLKALAVDAPPFDGPVESGGRGRMRSQKGVHWVKPELLAEVSFAEWTREGRVRHSVFHGLRSDKPARKIVREEPRHVELKESAASGARTSRAALPGGFRLSNPDRVIDKSTGLTKLDLARHYASVAPVMMPHLQDRPMAVLRAPQGIGGELFFQKHQEKFMMDGIEQLPGLDPGHGPLMMVARPEGLLAAAQMNVVELHTWNGRRDRIEQPDRMTFDLDPGEGVAWPQIQEAAQLVHGLLKELDLVAFLKTSGGKGLHVVAPLKRLHDWDTVKGFSQAIVQHLAQTLPDRFSAKSGPRNRVGRIFADYLRNGRGATTVAAWSARARPGMGVSVPVKWSELDTLESGAHWTVETVGARIRVGNEPWAGYEAGARSLGEAMKRLGWKPAR